MNRSAPVSLGRVFARAGLFFLAFYLAAAGGKFAGRVLYPLYLINILVVVGGGLAWLAWRGLHRRNFPATIFDLPLLVWLAGFLVSSLASQDRRLSLETFVYYLVCALIFYLMVDLQRAGKPVETWLVLTLLGGGWFLVFGGEELIGWYLRWLAIGGWQDPIPPATMRVQATMGHANVLAAYLNLLWPLAAARILSVRSRWLKAILGLYVLSLLELVFFTSSRGGWLGCAAGLGMLVFLLALDRRAWLCARRDWLRGHRRVLAGLALAGLAGLALVSVLLLRQAQNPSHPQGDPRGYIWRVALDMFRDRPLLGAGPGMYVIHFLRTYSIPPGMLLPHAHNFLIHQLGENGLWGAISTLWLGIVLAWACRKRWLAEPHGQRALLAGSIAALAGLGVHSLFEVPQVAPLVNILTAALMAQIAAPLIVERRIHRYAGVLLAAGWLAVSGLGLYSLWGYTAYQRGLDAAGQNNWPAASNWLDEATRRDPGMAVYYTQAGLARAQDGRPLAPAIAEMEKGLALEGSYALDWFNLAALKQAAGDLTGALSAYSRAVELAPDSAELRLGLGQALEQNRQAQVARELYRKLLEESPSLAGANFFKATPLRAEVVAQMPPQPADPLDGWQALERGEYERAERLFHARLRVNDAEGYLGLALALAGQGKAEEAEKQMHVAEFVDPLILRKPVLPIVVSVGNENDLPQISFRTGIKLITEYSGIIH